MTAEEIKQKARHEIDTPGHPDYGKIVYTFTDEQLVSYVKATVRETMIKLSFDIENELKPKEETPLPCGMQRCINPHEKLYRGCDICKFNMAFINKTNKEPKPKFKCYEIWRPNIPDNGCETQCKECAEREARENGNIINEEENKLQ